jgi:hypothetical protein
MSSQSPHCPTSHPCRWVSLHFFHPSPFNRNHCQSLVPSFPGASGDLRWTRVEVERGSAAGSGDSETIPKRIGVRRAHLSSYIAISCQKRSYPNCCIEWPQLDYGRRRNDPTPFRRRRKARGPGCPDFRGRPPRIAVVLFFHVERHVLCGCTSRMNRRASTTTATCSRVPVGTEERREFEPQPLRHVPPSNRGLFGLLILVVVSLTISACNTDACALGQFRCRDNVAEYCSGEERAPNKWVSTDCGPGFCHLSSEPDVLPFCALTEGPDPRCAPPPDKEFCQDNEFVRCREGYVVQTYDCTAGATFGGPLDHASAAFGFCANVGNAAFCSLESTPSPLCRAPSDGAGRTCDGDRLLLCVSGYLVSRQDCPPPGTCTLSGYTFCTLGRAADPACPPGAQTSFCRDGTVQGCTFGWVTWQMPCPDGISCNDLPTGGACT